MLPLLAHLFHAFFLDERSFRRWVRGLVAAAVPIGVQLLVDKSWPTWTFHEWILRAIPSVFAFAHGAIQSAAGKRGAADIEPAPREPVNNPHQPFP